MYMLCARYAKTHVLGASSSSFRTEASEEKKKMLYRDQVELDIASLSFYHVPKAEQYGLVLLCLVHTSDVPGLPRSTGLRLRQESGE